MKRQTTHPDRARRRADAAARQEKRDARSTAEQLVLIGQRPGTSTRETLRLERGQK
jgi:hypothetical protein